MEGVLVSAATGALKAVTEKLATLLGDEFKNLKDVRKDIKSLSDELKYMHAFLQSMSEKENPDEQDKIWMTDVREMSYDIEDSLDEFVICINSDNKSAKKKGLLNKCKELLHKMKTHKRISKAIKEYKTHIKEVAERNHRYRTVVTTTKDPHEIIDIRGHAIFKDASELVGIEEQKNELINLLTEDGSSCQHQAKVVSIVGFGGLGKTTLANQLYESIKDKFDCHAFVTVSRTPCMMEILRTILRDINGQEYTGDMQHLIKKISDFLQDKRYLVIVDDLWDSESWIIIQNAFVKNSCASRIITTTRKIEVAESCCSLHWGHIYRLRPLSPKSSRKLFLKGIFGSEEGCPSDLSEVCDDIFKKCDGLPLAIIAIAGLLAGKAPTVDEWSRVQHSFGRALERQSDINRMIQILSLSYFDLPLHLRSCLLYLSLFPEDYKIGKDRLILRWIAEGFIREDHGFTQYELGNMCFNELINRSLIQPVGSDFLGVFACQVHDTILEFILAKAVEENFVTLFGVPDIRVDQHKKIRRLSLQDTKVSNELVGSRDKIIYYHARTVLVFPASIHSLPSLHKFKHLRVLDLEGCEGLQAHHLAHLGGLFALRYLSLCRTGIDRLPKEIGELQYLETLDLRGTFINELPSSVGRLAWLVTLFCEFCMRLPDGFGKNMQALQQLECINVSIQSASFAQELRQLRNLRILKITIINNEVSEDLMSSLCTLGTGCLNSLVIGWNKQHMKLVMEPWSPIPAGLKIKRLKIWGIEVPRVPRWIGSLNNLQDLTLYVEQLGVADFGLLGSLNALSILSLPVNTEVVDRSSSSQGIQRIKISGTHGFPTLRRFQVGSKDCAFGLLFEVGAMPKLQELNLEFDTDKTRPLTDGEFDFGIQHLPCLALVRCFIGYFREACGGEEYEPEHPAWYALQKAVNSHPNHPKLSQLSPVHY